LRMTRLTVVVAVSVVLLSVCVAGATSLGLSPVVREGHDQRIDEAEEKFRLAFTALNAADEIGASGTQVSVLTERLNTALNLMREARALEADGNSSAAVEYASQSLAISDGVLKEAEDLREATSEASFWRRVLLFASAPVVGLIAAVVFYYAYRARRRPGMEKVLRMGIRRKDKNG